MITEPVQRDISTIEDYTLFSLARSKDGLAMLVPDAQACSAAYAARETDGANRLLVGLMRHIRDFDVFLSEMLSFLLLDPASIRDDRGSLAQAEHDFRVSCTLVVEAFGRADAPCLASALRDDVAPALRRFAELLLEVSRIVVEKYVAQKPNHG